MLHEFLTSNRKELLNRCRAKVALRAAELPVVADQGVPIFLQQLTDALTLPLKNVFLNWV